MAITCNICRAEYTLSSVEIVDLFCKHVAKCPLRSDNELQNRYSCSICKTVVQHNKSFKEHILKFHVERSLNDPALNILTNHRNTIGKLFASSSLST